MTEPAKIAVRIERSHPDRWEEFHVDYRPNANVISVLMQIQRNPVTADGKKTTPPAWDAACLEEVCGSCTMNINGSVRQACTALIENICELKGDTYELCLEPMKKFPVVRDLLVDRSKMFDNLKKVKAWVPIDGSYDLGMAQPQSDAVRHLRYAFSRCMTCGCCLEACPQVNERSTFVGPATLARPLTTSTLLRSRMPR